MAQRLEQVVINLEKIDRKVEKLSGELVLKQEFAKLETDVQRNKEEINTIKSDLSIVSHDVALNKRIIYGTITLTLSSVLLALLGLVLIGQT